MRFFRSILLFFFSLLLFSGFSQGVRYTYDGESKNSISSFKKWKYQLGDNIRWKDTIYNDVKWDSVIPDDLYDSKENKSLGVIWFRTLFNVHDSLLNKPLAFTMEHNGASEIFIDAKKIITYGIVSPDKQWELGYNPQGEPQTIVFNKAGNHLIAIRYSNHKGVEWKEKFGFGEKGGFDFSMDSANEIIEEYNSKNFLLTALFIFLTGSFLTLFFIHIVLFFFYQREKTNLYYSLFTLSFTIGFLCLIISEFAHNSEILLIAEIANSIMDAVTFISVIALIYSFTYNYLPKRFWWLFGAACIYVALLFLYYPVAGFILGLIGIFVFVDGFILIVKHLANRYDSKKKIRKRLLYFFILLIVIAIGGAFINTGIPLVIGIAIASIVCVLLFGSVFFLPFYMSFRHAKNFAVANKNLEIQLQQVKELSELTIEQEKEKKRILESQKEDLEEQVKIRTAQVEEQKKLLEERNKDTTDSINYASRIQNSILPDEKYIKALLPESFIFYSPKDIVSGDFYFFNELENGDLIIAAADCTGHGVPGALMSMIGHNFLSQIITEKEITQPAEILTELHLGVRNALKQDNELSSSHDGMDIALCKISKKKKNVTFAGAQRPIYIIRNGHFNEIKGNKFSIAGFQNTRPKLEQQKFAIEKGDLIYIFTDGFADQFGGAEGKKFLTRRFKELLLSVSKLGMEEQKSAIQAELIKWKSNKEQVDDILVIGVRL